MHPYGLDSIYDALLQQIRKNKTEFTINDYHSWLSLAHQGQFGFDKLHYVRILIWLI
jgi:hypothetical protein